MNKNPILKGQHVRAFAKPISEKDPIGLGEVISYEGATPLVTDSGDILHYCNIRFNNQPLGEMDQKRLVTVNNIVALVDESSHPFRKPTDPRDAEIAELNKQLLIKSQYIDELRSELGR